MKITIERQCFVKNQIMGLGKVTSSKGEMFFVTLEPKWENNKQYTAIPAGVYNGELYKSPTKGKVILLKNVPNRTWIEIHSGNFRWDTKGCIIVGEAIKNINGDWILDIINSKKTLRKILKLYDGNIIIEIIDKYK